MKANRKFRKNEEAAVSEVMGAIVVVIFMIVGFAIATVLTIFTNVLGGQTYQLTEADIDAITNTTIKDYVKSAISGGFQAQSQISSYLPLIALAVVITIVIMLVVSGIAGQFFGPGSMSYGYGGGRYGGYGGIL